MAAYKLDGKFNARPSILHALVWFLKGLGRNSVAFRGPFYLSYRQSDACQHFGDKERCIKASF